LSVKEGVSATRKEAFALRPRPSRAMTVTFHASPPAAPSPVSALRAERLPLAASSAKSVEKGVEPRSVALLTTAYRTVPAGREGGSASLAIRRATTAPEAALSPTMIGVALSLPLPLPLPLLLLLLLLVAAGQTGGEAPTETHVDDTGVSTVTFAPGLWSAVDVVDITCDMFALSAVALMPMNARTAAPAVVAVG
jgi:hypothetical protein